MEFADLVPVVYLHSDETLVPISVAQYTSHADLELKDGTITNATLDDLKFFQQQGPVPIKMTLKSSFDWTSLQGRSGKPECYIKARRISASSTQVDFWYLFGFNPGYCRPCRMVEGCAGAHQADWENVTMVVETDSHRIEQVYFSSHGSEDGYWKLAKDCEFESFGGQRRLVAYCALNAHGFYHKAGTFIRLGCVANDYTDRGFPVIASPAPAGPWLQYDFDWGNWTTSTPEWQELLPTSNTTWRRFCCFSECDGDQKNWCLAQGPLLGRDSPSC